MKAVVLVIDSFGVGALPDAGKYGDSGANTALSVCSVHPDSKLVNLKKMGLGNCLDLLGTELPGCEKSDEPSASFGVMAEKSPGKDTTTGHWEIAGIILDAPFYVFPKDYPSFPKELIDQLEEKTGRKILGNCAASGIGIIEQLGEEHMKTGSLICYTSADSVFQIAAHEGVIPTSELYEICEMARDLCNQYDVGRVIARPFTGTPEHFTRTKGRKDFSMDPKGESVLDYLKDGDVLTLGVGKIGNIFNEKGLSHSYPEKGNPACIKKLIELLEKPDSDNETDDELKSDMFIFVNLVDTDMDYGHRRDPVGYLEAVEKIDSHLPEMISLLDDQDLLIITADHGCDPGFKGFDHTREYIPLLVFRKNKKGRSLGIRDSFSDIAASLSEFFNKPGFSRGVSFLT